MMFRCCVAAEVCLSVLSPQIFHSGSRPGAGDIYVDRAGHFEIKATVIKIAHPIIIG